MKFLALVIMSALLIPSAYAEKREMPAPGSSDNSYVDSSSLVKKQIKNRYIASVTCPAQQVTVFSAIDDSEYSTPVKIGIDEMKIDIFVGNCLVSEKEDKLYKDKDIYMFKGDLNEKDENLVTGLYELAGGDTSYTVQLDLSSIVSEKTVYMSVSEVNGGHLSGQTLNNCVIKYTNMYNK